MVGSHSCPGLPGTCLGRSAARVPTILGEVSRNSANICPGGRRSRKDAILFISDVFSYLPAYQGTIWPPYIFSHLLNSQEN